ncbi:DUF2332 domain-containing protein [Oricola sp.]|uniref:DUF2332 domain-containing protein n=1 Tax=Oricola sp. TaxID=1979950 RepID=UPI003514ABD3
MSEPVFSESATNAFRRQAEACRKLGSPFTAALCEIFADEGLPAGPVLDRVTGWEGRMHGGADSVPLRLAGALHYLALSGLDSKLADIYPPNGAKMPTSETIFGAIERNGAFIDRYLDSPPQTNETGRSAILLPCFLHLRDRFDKPLVLSELGSSAGLNQNWHRYRYEYGRWSWGDLDSPVTLACEWRGDEPPPVHLRATVSDCAGCDISPVPIDTEDERLRLTSYVWADQPTRLARLSGALSVAAAHPPSVEAAGAADWLARRLEDARQGELHVVFHTIMWQYMPLEEQQRAQSLIEDAGRRATADAPFAWVRFEADRASDGAALTATIWPGGQPDGEQVTLGRGDFHGRWIDWRPGA